MLPVVSLQVFVTVQPFYGLTQLTKKSCSCCAPDAYGAAHFGVSCCVSTGVAKLRVFQRWKFFVLFYRKVHKKSVVFVLQAGVRVYRLFLLLCQRQNRRLLFVVPKLAGGSVLISFCRASTNIGFHSIFSVGQLVGAFLVFYSVQSFWFVPGQKIRLS
ncbi:hypothetical protein [Endozoicomonas ascidiicola]|uniref:hypothetical protein n=1 Tax=Endozoicomonas ascidiicola TaxID=1698521 RepID=UPI0008354BE4|nr:hypothetical protein [Endozoicomonas ascidiicola]